MAVYKEEIVQVRGRKVKLLRGGAGPQLLFLHDSFCPVWLPLHDRLAARFEIFLPIHPGFAGSDDGFEQFTVMEDLVFHYLDLCTMLQLERPALVGASFGGWIAAEWAVRYSDTMRRLILIDALGLRVDGAPAADIFSLDGQAIRRLVFGDPASTVALESVPDTPKADEMVSTILARRTLARFAWQFPDNPNLRRYLYRVQTPTLILWGERDGYIPLAHSEAYRQGIANSQVATITQGGHLPHIETPEVCADLVTKFLTEGG